MDRDRAARKVIGSFPGTRKSDGPDILSALILVEGRELDAAPLHGALKPQAGRRLPSTGVTHTIPLRPAHLAAAVLLVGARFVGIIAAYSDCNDFAVLGH